MNVNDPPIIRWYAATVILRCTINGKDGNPYSGVSRDIPAVQREVMLLRSHSPDVAYDLAIERATYNARTKWPSYTIASGELIDWEFAGLEDLHELPTHETLDGVVVWSRCVTGIPASALIYPKDDLTLFCPERGFFSCAADRH